MARVARQIIILVCTCVAGAQVMTLLAACYFAVLMVSDDNVSVTIVFLDGTLPPSSVVSLHGTRPQSPWSPSTVCFPHLHCLPHYTLPPSSLSLPVVRFPSVTSLVTISLSISVTLVVPQGTSHIFSCHCLVDDVTKSPHPS